MTHNELYRKVLEIMPGAQMGEDNDGQLVIYTDLCEMPNQEQLFNFGEVVEAMEMAGHTFPPEDE